MQKFECSGCGGQLKQEGHFWICENCGTKYALGRNDEGNPFTYQPIEKKEIEFGQMAEKASQIVTESIAVKEIKLSDSIDADVHKESTNIEIRQNVQIISRFLGSKEWDAAQAQINQVLLADNHNAEAHWYGWMCDKRLSSESALIASFSSFSRSDGQKLDDILANSTPDFAKHIINLLFEQAYLNDNMCFEIMSVILPYAKNELLFSNKEFKTKTSNALGTVISKVYPQSFDYLIKGSLESSDVDLYISYLQKFGDNCKPQSAQKYYQEILKIEPGNIAIHKKLVTADIKADSISNKCIADFENLLKYSENADKEVVSAFNFVASDGKTTSNNSQFVWSLIGYHSGAPEALKSNILAYSRVLLQSSLWEQARKFLQLILSFDSQNADAYWLLCLEKLQAHNEKEIENKKDNLIDCPEFKKSLALYQSAGNEQKANELMSYTQKQKAKKKATKIGIMVGAAVIVFIALLYVFNLIKYNANISVSFNGAPYADGWSYNELPMVFKNKGLTDISSLTGVMTFYNEDGDQITATKLNLSNLSHGEERELEITLDSSSAKKLYEYHFESVKITWTTTSVFFSDNKSKDFGEGKEKTIKKATKSSKEIDKDLEAGIRKQYDAAMKAYDAVDISSPSFETDITKAVAMLDNIWEDMLKSKTLLKDMYNKGCNYQKNKEYEKAYFLFSLLANYDYEDSYSRANECYYNAS